MNVLAELSSDSEGSGEDEAAPPAAAAPAPKRQRKLEQPRLEDLQELGFVQPSILLARAPAAAPPQASWAWGQGERASRPEPEGEAEAERAAMREVGARVEEEARLARLAAQKHQSSRISDKQEAELREKAREEHRLIAEQRRLTFKQKEKRKRDMGQAKGGKGNYVEEEKRIARNHGVYSGFDT